MAARSVSASGGLRGGVLAGIAVSGCAIQASISLGEIRSSTRWRQRDPLVFALRGRRPIEASAGQAGQDRGSAQRARRHGKLIAAGKES